MYELVLIEWYDAFGCSNEWDDIKEVQKRKPCICQTVGWVIKDEESYKIIAPHLANGNQVCGDMCIPQSSIIKITTLRKATNV